jgi:hypothetical protein
VLNSPRMNRPAALTLMVGAFEWMTLGHGTWHARRGISYPRVRRQLFRQRCKLRSLARRGERRVSRPLGGAVCNTAELGSIPRWPTPSSPAPHGPFRTAWFAELVK